MDKEALAEELRRGQVSSSHQLIAADKGVQDAIAELRKYTLSMSKERKRELADLFASMWRNSDVTEESLKQLDAFVYRESPKKETTPNQRENAAERGRPKYHVGSIGRKTVKKTQSGLVKDAQSKDWKQGASMGKEAILKSSKAAKTTGKPIVRQKQFRAIDSPDSSDMFDPESDFSFAEDDDDVFDNAEKDSDEEDSVKGATSLVDELSSRFDDWQSLDPTIVKRTISRYLESASECDDSLSLYTSELSDIDVSSALQSEDERHAAEDLLFDDWTALK